MLIKAFGESIFVCVNDKYIYAPDEIPTHEHKSKGPDADYELPKPKKRYIPLMNHPWPWRKQDFSKFVHSRLHRIEEDIKSAC